jgi:isopentenyl-diphosphate Delta-isomerase
LDANKCLKTIIFANIQKSMSTEINKKATKPIVDNDPTAVSRKGDHISLAFQSQVAAIGLDTRFYYEPLLVAHPKNNIPPTIFGQKTLKNPIWVSSMTGGTQKAGSINHNLAKACKEFGMGMGLGSCRGLLYSDEHLADFDVRDNIGEMPLYANLGVAQIELLLEKNQTALINDLVEKLRADGLIVHINPLQEAMQPEGDIYKHSPLETIKRLLDKLDIPMIVKEVGQGFGPNSLRELLQLPLVAVEFAAAGGTNFAKLELLRSDPMKQLVFENITTVGHTAVEMVDWTNVLKKELGKKCLVKNLILSGGVKTYLDGYYLIKKSKISSIYGQASGFLQFAQGDYSELQTFAAAQVKGLELAHAFLQIK